MNKSKKMGKKIRKMRLSQGLSLGKLAKKIEKTSSYLSQIERGLAEPSIGALREIAEALEVPVFYFLVENSNHGSIVKKDERKILKSPDSNLTFELLSPDLNHMMEVMRVELEPGKSTSDHPVSHKGEEFIILLKGKMEIQLDEEYHELEEGDCIYLVASIPHNTTNIGDDKLVFISAITPPKF